MCLKQIPSLDWCFCKSRIKNYKLNIDTNLSKENLCNNFFTHVFMSSSWLTLILSWKPLLNLFFKCCAEPRHLHLPLTNTVIWVQSASHSSILCDVNKTDLPESRDWTMTFQRFRFVAYWKFRLPIKWLERMRYTGEINCHWSRFFQIICCLTGSMPADGSSNKITFKFPIMARHVLSFRLLPPLEVVYMDIKPFFTQIFFKFLLPQLVDSFVNMLNKIQIACIVFNIASNICGRYSTNHGKDF